MMNPARVLHRVVRSGVLQPILAANLLLLPCTPCALSQGPRNTPPTGVEDPYVILLKNQQALAKQNDQLRRQLAQMELLLKGMIEFQATIAAPKEAREAKAKEEGKRAADAHDQIQGKTDFGSVVGEKFREQLKADAEFVKNKPIDINTSKDDVEAVVERIQDAQQRIQKTKAEWEAKYREQRDRIVNSPIGKIVTGPITNEQLQRIEKALGEQGRQKLLDAVKKLDPKISTAELEKLAKDANALYAKIRDYSANGRWSPELVAALGDDLGRLVGVKELPKDIQQFVDTARTAVDVYRSAADFASFSISTMEAAISTGNPYVIAAAAIILLLIALFKFVFGGGGGGDGEGEGQGEGSVPGQHPDVARNTGTGGGGGVATAPGGDRPDAPKQPAGGPPVLVDGKPATPIEGLDPKGAYLARRLGTVFVIVENPSNKKVAEVPAGKVFFIDPKSGDRTVFGFDASRVESVSSYNPANMRIDLRYRVRDNQQPADANLRPDPERAGEWNIYGSLR